MSRSLEGKKALIFGVANQRSIAWDIAKSLHSKGVEIIISCQDERLLTKIDRFSSEINPAMIEVCDILEQDQVENLFTKVEEKYGKLDILIHSVAFAPADALNNPFLNVSKKDFTTAFQASVFSLIEVTKRASALMKDGGSVITLTYIGSNRVMPGYGIMGPCKAALECTVKYLANDLGASRIRVNCISAGPIKTLASSTFGNINKVLEIVEERTPLHHNISGHDVGEMAAFLASDDAKMTTGSILYVDSGANIVGA